MTKPTLRRSLAIIFISVFGLLFSMWILVNGSAAQEEEQEALVVTTTDPGDQTLFLEENVGQFDPRGRFLLRRDSGKIWLTEDGIWIMLQDQQALREARASWIDEETIDRPIPAVNIKLRFPDANPAPVIEPFDRQSARFSYLVGDSQADWFASIPVWAGVRYRDLYPGVDLVISADNSSSNGALLPWHLELDKAADLPKLELSIEGIEGLTLESGQIRLQTDVGSFALPLLNSGGPAGPDSAASALALPEPRVGQLGPQAFVIHSPLTSDTSVATQSNSVLADTTELIYSTYLGGSNTEAANGVAVDETGAIYVVGNTSSADFPVVPGSYDTTLNSQDVYVAKINPAGTGSSDLIYATFIGGSTLDFGLSIDESGGQAFITGETLSNNFPTTPGAYDTTCGDDALCDGHTDSFITTLNAAGTDLAYSSYLGASHDDRGNGITISGGELYIAGTTKSDDFPTTANAFDRTCGTDGRCNQSSAQVVFSDAFFVKFIPAGTGNNDLLYGTFLGGRSRDLGNDVAASGGDGFVTGRSE
ncbi:MAG: SBBP repeat-containing protein, partial [Chloroflexota bacterium]